jgi:hypothetical protein
LHFAFLQSSGDAPPTLYIYELGKMLVVDVSWWFPRVRAMNHDNITDSHRDIYGCYARTVRYDDITLIGVVLMYCLVIIGLSKYLYLKY